MFDVAVVGGGVTGCMAAYFAKKAGFNVVLYERQGIASGASGAAGAFISARIGKGGQLQTLTNEAFNFAIEFYQKEFADFFTQCGIFRIAKDDEDAKNYELYSQKLSINHQLTTYKKQKAIFFPQAGVVKAKKLCNALVKNIKVIQKEVCLNEIEAKTIILATGDQEPLLDLEYIGLRRTWGLRIDAKCESDFDYALHKNISISPSHDGAVKIGATHEREPFEKNVACQKGIAFLLEQAASLTDSAFEYQNCVCGTRSAVRDYFPLVGKAIDVKKSLKTYPMVTKGIKPRDGLIYHKNVYIIGGTGGRGFVFSPYLANALIGLIKDKKEIDSRIAPQRLFYKWARKLNKKTN